MDTSRCMQRRASHVAGPLKKCDQSLASNEKTPLGPSRTVAQSKRSGMRSNMKRCIVTRHPITQHCGQPLRRWPTWLDADRIIWWAGSDRRLLHSLCQSVFGRGQRGAAARVHGFGMYPYFPRWPNGATRRRCRKMNGLTDVDALLAAARQDTAGVYRELSRITHRHNGGPRVKIERLGAQVIPERAILVLAGPYAEIWSKDTDGGAALVDSHDNIVMTRTLSKGFLMAWVGLRIGLGGYCAGPYHRRPETACGGRLKPLASPH